MKIVLVTGPGVLEVLERPLPEPGPGEVLVRLRAATVNPVDTVALSGALHEIGLISHDDPIGVGMDAVGTVEATGADANTYSVGELVAGVRTALDNPGGALAEYVVLPQDDLAPVPAGLPEEKAAAIGMNALTASQALDMIGEPDGTLLVTGAAGALGGFAVELATEKGWQVAGLAREGDRDFVESRGATLVTELDGTTYDAVLDAAVLQERVLSSVASGGLVVGVQPALTLPASPDRRVDAVRVAPDGKRLADLLGRAAVGRLTPRVAGTVPLSRVAEAFAAVSAPGSRGRWVVVPD